MGESSDEAAIRAQIEAWAAAVRRRDMAGILRNHAGDMIMFDVPPSAHWNISSVYSQYSSSDSPLTAKTGVPEAAIAAAA